MKIGYARVSTDDQNLNLQIDALSKSGCDQIWQEKVSGRNLERPELQACLKSLRAGDCLVVWRLDRLGRSLNDLVKIVADLQARGVHFESVTEKIETVSATGKLTFHLFAALAEFERNLIRERTLSGLAASRARGVKGGRKPKLSKADKDQIRVLMNDKTLKVTDIAKRFGVSRMSVYNALKAH